MTASLRALLSGIIDYAGLFPPAELPLDQAIRNYARYRQEPESWMLGRFVIPAARLGELNDFLKQSTDGSAWPFAVLATEITFPDSIPRDQRRRWLSEQGLSEYDGLLMQNLHAIKEFRQRHGPKVVADTYEFRSALLGAGLLKPLEIVEFIGTKVDFILLHDPGIQGMVFMEIPPQEEAWDVLGGYRDASIRKRDQPVGFKLRCGGKDSSAFPTSKQVAHAIITCRDAGFPMKFTAGLHHPMRHYDAGLQTTMHGFLNVFVAGVLAHARKLGEAQVREILDDEDPKSFVFEEDHLRWKYSIVTVEEIENARRLAVTSFGSCSFDEPRDDLRALGLLG